MIYLVLKNPRVPTARLQSYFFTALIQTVNTNIKRAIHNCLEALQAKAAFEEVC